MEGLTKRSLTRLARRAGVKSMSEDCINTIKSLIGIKLNEICYKISIINEQRDTKTIMTTDAYEALRFMGVEIAKLDELS